MTNISGHLITVSLSLILMMFPHVLSVYMMLKINKIKPTLQLVLRGFFLKIMVMLILSLLIDSLSGYFLFIDEPLFYLLFSYYLFRNSQKNLIIFYGLLPVTLHNIFYRSVAFFILPFFGIADGVIGDDLIFTLIQVLSALIVILFIQWLDYDFRILNERKLESDDRIIIVFLNWAMGLYFLIMQSLSYLQYEKIFNTFELRKLIIIIYLILFMGMIKQLDSHLKVKLQAELSFQQDLHQRNLENYSLHMEELYREVRGFRHDYTNLLTTLKMGIEAGDLDQIEEVYHSVLKDTEERMRDSHFDFGRLVNIQEPALKSLLAAKFSEASDKGLEMHLEIPAPIQPKRMKLVDLITAVSVLVDNAIDESVSEISIAFFEKENSHVLIVENSIEEEAKDLKSIFDFGYSTKGEERGIGLYNLLKMIEKYPNVAIETQSKDYRFTQILNIF
ncbi:GHKL domain-containing protein [Streptococcus sp. NLN64]|uniref:sensor histidine kinase n=1 Tax=Streptococcus sp. NLN64 TaxID=2822799 RepID=UPI0018CBB5F8|nr:GHKL domain-containing protein [Streptococcus sp. NLN64]MBG9366699.1 GHKL domain-containing protein [Streptococcus sp. NLN64]